MVGALTRPTRYPPADLPEALLLDVPGTGPISVRDLPGPPDATTILLLHGWTATAALNWHSSFGALSEMSRVVAPDLRGHGATPRGRRRFELESCADDLAGLCAALGIERTVVVGYSMGGAVAQVLWQRHPRLVGGLVLCATASRFVVRTRRNRARRWMTAGLGGVSRWTPRSARARVHKALSERMHEDTQLGRWSMAERSSNDVRAILEAGAALMRFSSEAWIANVDVPSAVLVTDPDLVVSPLRQRWLAGAIPGALTFELPGPHDVCARRPSVFVPTLVQACAEVTSAASTTRLRT